MMFEGIFKHMEEGRRLEELEKKLNPAKLRGENKCVMCGFCCHLRTCIPTPDELINIAKFLKMTPKELISKHFAIDKSSSFSEDYYVKPLGVNILDLAGKLIPDERTWNEGKCVFLDKNNKCKIYPVRPKSARIQKCWKDEEHDHNPMEFWKNNILKNKFGVLK